MSRLPQYLMIATSSLLLAAPSLAARQGPVPDLPELEFSHPKPSISEAPGITSRTRARSNDPGAVLLIEMIESQIWNPAKGGFDKVRHRGYRDGKNPQAGIRPYAAPTIRARPGQTVRIDIQNHLDPEPACNHTDGTMNDPDKAGCYNATNNHFHGGWVNPDGNSDNVLRRLHPNPDVVYEYEYNIPSDHPAGTFWYHPHVHGSTAIQVGSGMAGALIINGERWPVEAADGLRAGDVDVLLRGADGKPIPDRTFLLQQIQYACDQDANGNGKPAAERWTCADGETGEIKDYTAFLNPGPTWAQSGRFTTVNGRVAAPLSVDARVGMPERWRLIHGGFTASARVQIFPARANADLAQLETTPAAGQREALNRNCAIEGDPIPLFEIAADGLTRAQVLEASARNLHPGYRSDVLVSFPTAGRYCVVDQGITPAQGIDGSLPEPRLLFSVNAKPGRGAPAPARQAITDLMVAAAERAGDDKLPAALRDEIVASLRDGLKLPMFAPHASLADARVKNVQHVRFNLLNSIQPDLVYPQAVPPGAGIGHVTVPFGEPTPAFIDLRFSELANATINLYLGDVDEWRLTSASGGAHPFHIHVNPFEIQAVMLTINRAGTPETIDLTQVESYLDGNGVRQESQYFGMKGVFKDTVIVEQGVEVIARSHYERYVGTFVLHCHILYHEDLGMMRLVRINDPLEPGRQPGSEGVRAVTHRH